MNKREYKQFRALLRENGSIAFRWWKACKELDRLQDLYNQRDILKEREDIVNWCKKEGLGYDFSYLRIVA